LRRAIGSLLVAAGSGLTSFPTLAQTTPAPAPAPVPSASDVAPSERAKRDADKVFHWIMIQGDRTRKTPAAAAKDSKDAKDDRPAAKPIKLAAPEPASPRPKPDASVAAAEPSHTKPAGKLAERPIDAAVPAAIPSAVAAAPNSAGIARAEPVAVAVAAPAVEPVDDAPQSLVALAQPAPQFPVSVMRTLRRGTVQVRFNVMTDGSVSNLEVLHTTSARLNNAALEAIAQWRFQPVSKMQTGAVEVGFDLE
jgi:TonB family protein